MTSNLEIKIVYRANTRATKNVNRHQKTKNRTPFRDTGIAKCLIISLFL